MGRFHQRADRCVGRRDQRHRMLLRKLQRLRPAYRCRILPCRSCGDDDELWSRSDELRSCSDDAERGGTGYDFEYSTAYRCNEQRSRSDDAERGGTGFDFESSTAYRCNE